MEGKECKTRKWTQVKKISFYHQLKKKTTQAMRTVWGRVVFKIILYNCNPVPASGPPEKKCALQSFTRCHCPGLQRTEMFLPPYI
jgi:hypothetical protein